MIEMVLDHPWALSASFHTGVEITFSRLWFSKFWHLPLPGALLVSYPWAASNSRPWATNPLFQEHRQVQTNSGSGFYFDINHCWILANFKSQLLGWAAAVCPRPPRVYGIGKPVRKGTPLLGGRKFFHITSRETFWSNSHQTKARCHWEYGRGSISGNSGVVAEAGVTNSADWWPVEGSMMDFNYIFSNCLELTMELACDWIPDEELIQVSTSSLTLPLILFSRTGWRTGSQCWPSWRKLTRWSGASSLTG